MFDSAGIILEQAKDLTGGACVKFEACNRHTDAILHWAWPPGKISGLDTIFDYFYCVTQVVQVN